MQSWIQCFEQWKQHFHVPPSACWGDTKKGLPEARRCQWYHGDGADQGPRGGWFASGPHHLSELPCDYSPQAFQQKEDFDCFEEQGEK